MSTGDIDVELIDELPRTTTGKVLRRVLLEGIDASGSL